MARRVLTETDLEAWAAYARHVAVLPGRAAPALTPEPPRTPPIQVAVRSEPSPAPRSLPTEELAIGRRPSGIDYSTWGRLQAGKLRPERTLDLHGRTAQHAFHALQAFLYQAQAERLRCVEVITGRGSGEAGGVIRRELPLWLNLPPLRPLVLGLSHPHAANTGSVRLLLRRKK